tara:strand:+ start:460 stop:969 length:510 start_codon:yes stop_codon:yes gene_type:complete
MQINRNDPCHCGSGKKYKSCHGLKSKESPWKKVGIYGAIALVAVWFFKDVFSSVNNGNTRSAPPGKVWSEEHGHYHDINTNRPPIPPKPLGVDRSLNVPQPEGPVPEGKVWSPEHGHWHDAATSTAPSQTSPVQQETLNIPQPDGPVPEGKEWSTEHGHWHDITPKQDQ